MFSLNNQNNNNFQIGEYKLPAKTNTVAFDYPFFLVGAQDAKIALLNIDRVNDSNFSINDEYINIFEEHHGHLKFTTSALSSEKKRILLGTADGRIVNTTWT